MDVVVEAEGGFLIGLRACGEDGGVVEGGFRFRARLGGRPLGR